MNTIETMDDSIETNFILQIHKTLLSFHYLEKRNQKFVLQDIQKFIYRLTQIFQNHTTLSKEERRKKIIDILVKYLQKLNNEQIKSLIHRSDREALFRSIEKDAYDSTLKHLKKVKKNTSPIQQEEVSPSPQYSYENEDDDFEDIYIDNGVYVKEEKKEWIEKKREEEEGNEEWIERLIEKIEKEMKRYEEKMIHKILECKKMISMVDEENEKKIEVGFKANMLEVEKTLKKMVYDNFSNMYEKEKETMDKLNMTLEEMKETCEKMIFEKIDEEMKKNFEELYHYLQLSIQESTKNIQKMETNLQTKFEEKIEQFICETHDKMKENFQSMTEKNNSFMNWKEEWDLTQKREKEDLRKEFEKKLNVLSDCIQSNIHEFIEKIQLQQFASQKTIDIGIFSLDYAKEENHIHLLHNQDIISTIKLNPKGMIGPKGPQGQIGKTPIIKNIRFTHDARVIFVIEGEEGDYELTSQERIPSGPQGPQGLKGDPGVVYTEMKLNDKNVLRVDHENLNNLIILKSLCIGENSHCLSEQSLSIGGGICYKQDSLSIGKNAKAHDQQSIALYGTTIGNNAFAYHANNVEDNCVQFGDTMNDIEKIELHGRKIVLDARDIEIRGRVYLKHIDDKITMLDKKIQEILKMKHH